jgi:hypothetical protein
MRRLIVFAVLLFCYPPAYGVDGFNMPGFDYANFDAESPLICRNSCGGDSRCQGWTWAKPGVRGPAAHCWLKYKLPNLVKDACCSSGPRKYISQSEMKPEDHTDRPGLDYSHFSIDSWSACQQTCLRDQKCAAWTYVAPGTQGPQAQCWLKRQVPNPVKSASAISGVKYRPAAVAFDDNN